MTAEQITTIITNLLTGTGVVFFLGMVIRGLKNQIVGLKAQIGTLNKTIEVQQKTMEAMETRVSETEKVGNIYKKLIEELPDEVVKYKALITKLKDDQIDELKKANEHKDEKLKETAKVEIENLELQRQLLDDIPKLLGQFTDTARTIEHKLSIVGQLSEVGLSPARLPSELVNELQSELAFLTEFTQKARQAEILITGDLAMGDTYNIRGQAGAVGPNAQANDMNQMKIDPTELAKQLAELRNAIVRRQTPSTETAIAVSEIVKAEIAIEEKNPSEVLQHLKAAGEWTLEVAKVIGSEAVVAAIKQAMGGR